MKQKYKLTLMLVLGITLFIITVFTIIILEPWKKDLIQEMGKNKVGDIVDNTTVLNILNKHKPSDFPKVKYRVVYDNPDNKVYHIENSSVYIWLMPVYEIYGIADGVPAIVYNTDKLTDDQYAKVVTYLNHLDYETHYEVVSIDKDIVHVLNNSTKQVIDIDTTQVEIDEELNTDRP